MFQGTALTSLRSKVAPRTPAFLRKAVRMGEQYWHRQVAWFYVLCEMKGRAPADKLSLGASALFSPLLSLANLDSYQGPRLLGDLTVVAKGAGQFHLRAGTDDIIHVLDAREPRTRKIVEALVKPGDVFVDAGANIGFFSLIASRLAGENGQVFAFEMMPVTAACLRAHVEANNARNVTIVENALSDGDGQVVVATSPADKAGQASIVTQHEGWHERLIRYEVRTVTLDKALADIDHIRLMKMDLEGAEYLALKGGEKVLSRTDAVVFESNTKDKNVFNLLKIAGFSIEPIEGNNYLARRDTIPSSR